MKKVKINKKLQEWMAGHINNISYVMNLDDFEFFLRSSKLISPRDKRLGYMTKKVSDIPMCIEVDNEYLTARIIYNDHIVGSWYKDGKYSALIDCLCHEIAHTITTEPFDEFKVPYKGRGKILQERLTERVGRLIKRLYYNYMKDCKIDVRTGKKSK